MPIPTGDRRQATALIVNAASHEQRAPTIVVNHHGQPVGCLGLRLRHPVVFRIPPVVPAGEIVALDDLLPVKEQPPPTGPPSELGNAVGRTDGAARSFRAKAFDVVVRPMSGTDDADVAIYVVLNGPAAPSSFDFELTVRDGTGTVLTNGAVEFLASDGEPVGVIDPPWGVDATGQVVKTWYPLRSTTLTLHVEHRGSVYPVVADPVYTNNCGITTCSSYWSRGHTRSAVYLAGIFTVAISWPWSCTYIPSGDGDASAACLSAANTFWAVPLSVNLTQASYYYKCIKLTRLRHTPILTYI